MEQKEKKMSVDPLAKFLVVQVLWMWPGLLPVFTLSTSFQPQLAETDKMRQKERGNI